MKNMGEKEINNNIVEKRLDYLKLLSRQFPTISAASTEIINLQAILNLPKGTEHFISDIHGEYESFIHVLKNASGVIKLKIDDVFGSNLSEEEKKSLAILIYYPEEKINIVKKEGKNIKKWYEKALYQLIEMSRNASSKYTRSKVRKSLPKGFTYILEELLHEDENRLNKEEYYKQIIRTIIEIDRAREFIIALSNLIQRLVIDRLHIIGDIFDRGPGADIILDKLINYHNVDLQWGNHDILWMGAGSGSLSCIANVLRISLRYGNMDTLEDGYGINMLPLATFALEFYKDEKNRMFDPKDISNKNYSKNEVSLIRKMHKAITIIQFKLEGQIIKRRPEFGMNDRLLLDKINLKKGTILLDNKIYELNDNYFPTLDAQNPYQLTPEEDKVIEKIRSSFLYSEKLRNHIKFFYSKGSLYLTCNSNLLFHGCIPMNSDGTFKELLIDNRKYRGRALYDRLDRLCREAYFTKINFDLKSYGADVIWYMWCGPHSPLFGKNKMATLERYFIDDKTTHKENKDPFFKFRDDEKICDRILKDFKLDPENSHIFCGHIPVKVKDGESPIKSNGKLIVLDGGFSKAYQPQTGIAGYTLIFNSHGLQLVSHEPFESTQKAIEEEKDILSVKRVLEHSKKRIRIINTDVGNELQKEIDDLKMLLYAFKKGLIKEKT